LRERNQRPWWHGPLKLLSGPERIEGGWWDSSDVQRDYYIVRTSNGENLWIFRDLSKKNDWYLHGFWS
jgi:protein ImuB